MKVVGDGWVVVRMGTMRVRWGKTRVGRRISIDIVARIKVWRNLFGFM